MKNKYYLVLIFALLLTNLLFAQDNSERKKINITGTIIEKISKQPLEYATITLINNQNPKKIGGGITNSKGEFNIEIISGNYTLKIEYISFKPLKITEKIFNKNTNLGIISLEEDYTQLKEVEIRAAESTVEIKLDKKVYNVGQDLMVKGGTVSDVLNNIPSVSIDVEGNVSLRGNENVKVLIDGRPSNAINIAEALRLIPADAIDKVEVITNPSARYDAEGGGGLLNIILKKGKNKGFNATFIATAGYPDNQGLIGTINYKMDNFSLFSTQGYNYKNLPGNSFLETDYLNPKPGSPNTIVEIRDNDRLNKGYNGNFGMQWNLTKSLTWINTFNYRKSDGDNIDSVFFNNVFLNPIDNFTRTRINYEDTKSENIEFATSFVKKFKKDGHKLNIDTQYATNDDLNTANIFDDKNGYDTTLNDQRKSKTLVQLDYVLPLGKGSQFETGYRGDFTENITDVSVFNNNIVNTNFTNILEYKEKVNGFYSQFGFKISKFSFLFGLRWEDSNIEVNQINTNKFSNKKYDNFFPSAFLVYEVSEKSSASLSYSRRINRPRGRQLNPFSNYSSNINIFQGNPDINPAMTDAIDFGYIKRWTKLTLSTSFYFNRTKDVFQFVRKESGQFNVQIVDGIDTVVNGEVTQVNGGEDIRIPIIINSPVNLNLEYRTGFEFTLNFSPYKWWKLNGNFNFFRAETQGGFSYIDFNNKVVLQNFDNVANSWFTRLNSKISLPGKIDWQTNATYNGPQTNAQGKSLGVFSGNLAFSKDILKDKGTLSFNINDVLNSRKRIMENFIPNFISSYTEMQWNERQITLSFTYRFNKLKNDNEKPIKRPENNESGEF